MKQKKVSHKYDPFDTVVVPVPQGALAEDALRFAVSIARSRVVYLLGILKVQDEGEILNAAPMLRRLRTKLAEHARAQEAEIKIAARVTLDPWAELVSFVRDIKPKLTALSAQQFPSVWQIGISEMLSKLPSDVAIVQGPIPVIPKSLLIPIRGGRYAELALRAGLSIAHNRRSKITALHLEQPKNGSLDGESLLRADSFRSIKRVLKNLAFVNVIEKKTHDAEVDILEEAQKHDLVIIGSTAKYDTNAPALGWVAQHLMERGNTSIAVMRTKEPIKTEEQAAIEGASAITILIDKWLAENTFHKDEFKDLELLVSRKREQGIRVSVALPALNEEKTIGKVISTIQSKLMQEFPLVDELVLMDSDSKDKTRDIAKELGVAVHIHQKLLSNYGGRTGKGEALWKSLFVTKGDIIIWVDTDIKNFNAGFVYGVLGPMLLNPSIKFSKGFYKRPLRDGGHLQSSAGGRVTELTAKPLINLFYPELSGVLQPLSGEYGGRREVLEQLPFFSGYGVEIGLLIEVFQRFGLSAIAQVNLSKRIHNNQPLQALSKMSFAIMQAVLEKLEERAKIQILDELNTNMKIIRSEAQRLYLDICDIKEVERPPMIELPEYKKKRGM